jgi:FAD:protein FMN transferase
LNAQGVLFDPDHRLVDLIRFANDISRDSDGAFDVSVQPLWALWHGASRQRRIPSDDELRQARQRVGWQGIQVENKAIRLRPGMALTLNGIAQGYASDRAREVLVTHGIEQALLDTGEWTAMSRDYRAANWRLGLANPRLRDTLITTLIADGRSVATSSDEHTYFTEDRRHHHIFDPFNGRSPASLASVTVLAPSCAKADALTKVFFMADRDGVGLARRDESNTLIQAAVRLTRQWQVDALLVDKQGHWWGSPGLPLAG